MKGDFRLPPSSRVKAFMMGIKASFNIAAKDAGHTKKDITNL